jgi:hypothetical protein
MKTISLLLFAGLAIQAADPLPQHRPEPRPSLSTEAPLIVFAENPAFGYIWASTLAEAEAQAKAMTSLDPLCGVVQELCMARFKNTIYFGIFADGSTRPLFVN